VSPEIKKLILNNFELFLTFGAFLVWMVLIRYQWPPVALFRKLVLAGFTVLFFNSYVSTMTKVIAYLDRIDVDVFLRRHFAEYKGTDWVDGFLWGIAISFFAGFLIFLWIKDFTTKG